MKAAWRAVRILSASTAFTKQSNKGVRFPIATLRPSHQTGWLPRGRTGIRAYPSYNWKSRFEPGSANCSVPKASAAFLSNGAWRSIFSKAVDTALKVPICASHRKAPHLRIPTLAFTGNVVTLKTKALSMRPLNNTRVDLLQSASVL